MPRWTTRLGRVCSSDFPSKTTSPGVEPIQPRDHVERRRLAGAVRADEADDGAVGDVEGHVVERRDAAEPKARVLEREHQSAACSERPPADCMPAIIPGGDAPFGKRDEHLAEQRVRLPALGRVEQLARAPALERVDGAAPDVEHLAGDRLRLVRAERDDDGGDVRRVERVEALLRRAHLERLLGHARARVRREAVDGDAVALELLRDDDREAGDARLRGAVVRLADVAEDARRARGADDAPAHVLARLRLLAPVRGGVLRRREVALEVDGDDGVPLLLGHVHEHPVAEDPGVVDEDVEAAELVDRLLDHATGAREVGDVLAVRDRLAAGGADLLDDLLGRRRGRRLRPRARRRGR